MLKCRTHFPCSGQECCGERNLERFGDLWSFEPLVPCLPFSSQRSKPGYRGSRPTCAFGAACSRRWTILPLGHHIGWKPLVVDVPDFERQASQVTILGETRLLPTPLRDGGTQFLHGWRTAPLFLSLHTLVRSCNCRTFSKFCKSCKHPCPMQHPRS